MAEGLSWTARIRRVRGAPVVAVRIWMRGGARSERLPGQALVTGRMLTEGSRRRGWREIAERAESRGMSLAGFGAFELCGVAADALAADWERAIEWAAELVLEPIFPRARLDWMIEQAAAELESLEDRPEVVAGWAFLRQLYDPHPRGRPLYGSAESLRALGVEDCRRFHRESLARGLIVSVAGEVDEERCRAAVERLLGAPVETRAVEPSPPPPRGLPERRIEVETSSDGQVHLLVGRRTVSRADADFAPLQVLGVALGSGPGLTGRFPARIRELEGLAYVVTADTVAGAGLDRGHLVIYAASTLDRLEAVERAVGEELARLLDGGLSAEEVAGAVAYLQGAEPFRRETARQWADLLAEAELLGLPLDRPEWIAGRLEQVTPQRVEAAARRHLAADGMRTVVGRPRRGAAGATPG